MKALLLTLSISLIASCGMQTKPLGDFKIADFQESSLIAPDAGFVYLGTDSNCKGFCKIEYFVQSTEPAKEGEENEILTMPAMKKVPGTPKELRHKYMRASTKFLAAGKYKIIGWEFSLTTWRNKKGTRYNLDRQKLDVPFEVKAGKLNYIGSVKFNFKGTTGATFYPKSNGKETNLNEVAPLYTQATVSYQNKVADDRQEVAKFYRNLRKDLISSSHIEETVPLEQKFLYTVNWKWNK